MFFNNNMALHNNHAHKYADAVRNATRAGRGARDVMKITKVRSFELTFPDRGRGLLGFNLGDTCHFRTN